MSTLSPRLAKLRRNLRVITNPIFRPTIHGRGSLATHFREAIQDGIAGWSRLALEYGSLWLPFALGLLILVGIYGFWAEPYWIEVTQHRLEARFSPPLKIAHLSDLHTYGLGRREQDILELLSREKPDLIAITGDTLSQSGTYEMCRQFLERLHAPLGVWLVPGNYENARRLENETSFYDNLNINYLVNASRQLRSGVWIVGVDDAASGNPNLEAALAFVPREAYTLVLSHSPAYFKTLAGHCNLVLSGHSHGGQVRLPLLGPLWTPAGVDGFVQGWYEKEESRMYVTRGLGTTIVDIRLLCRPELAFITVGR